MNPSMAAIVLILTYIMPGNMPDIQRYLSMPTAEECWSQAKDFVAAGVPKKALDHGVVGLAAACRENLNTELKADGR